jgi:hypothetical protein
MKRTKTVRFESEVLDGHKGLAFELPFSPPTRWGLSEVALRPARRGYRVQGSVNAVRFESVVVPRAKRFWLLVTDEMKKAGRLRAGSSVRVSVGPLD